MKICTIIYGIHNMKREEIESNNIKRMLWTAGALGGTLSSKCDWFLATDFTKYILRSLLNLVSVFETKQNHLTDNDKMINKHARYDGCREQ